MTHRAAWLALALAATGCAGSAASARVVAPMDGDPGSAGTCTSPVSAWAVPTGTAAARAVAAVLTQDEATELRVEDLLAGRPRWQRPVRASVRPLVLDDVVVTIEGTELVAFDIADGSVRLRGALPEGRFVGAAQVGRLVVFVVNAPTWDPLTRHSTLGAWHLDSGALRYARRVPELLGRPHAAGPQIWALSDRRDVRAFDAADGGDVACTPLADAAVVDGVQLDAAGLWFGTKEPQRLGAGTETPPLAPPKVDAPADFQVLPTDYDAVPATRSAHGRIGWLTTTTPPGPFYFAFYRHLIAYAHDGSVRWAKVFPRDVVRALPTPTGLWLVLEDGAWFALEASGGAMHAHGSLGREIASAELAVHDAPLDAASAPPSPTGVHSALAAMALDPDTRLLPSRRLAVDALSKLDGDAATRDLLGVARAPSTPAALRSHVVTRLTERTSGLDPLLQALDERYDFLQGTAAPPLRVLLPPLMAHKEVRALPALERHLMDPATPLSDLPLCVQALETIGGATAHGALARFVAMYRRDSVLAPDDHALALAERLLAPAAPSETATTPVAAAEVPPTPVVSSPPVTAAPATRRPPSPRPTPAPFWALSEARAPKPWFIPRGDPWWRSQNDLFISIEAPAPEVAPTSPPPPPSASGPAPAPSAADAWWTPVSP